MLLSKSCMYGIRSALYLACLGQDRFMPIRTISEDLTISFHFLTKILQTLTHHNLMTSFRGPTGGIALARPPAKITLMEIIQAIDGPGLFQECVLGLPGCGDHNPCPLHHQWGTNRERLKRMFEGTTLADLVTRIHNEHLRLDESGRALKSAVAGGASSEVQKA